MLRLVSIVGKRIPDTVLPLLSVNSRCWDPCVLYNITCSTAALQTAAACVGVSAGCERCANCLAAYIWHAVMDSTG